MDVAVAFYSYGALGTDRYPPFTLDDVPDYPARLSVEYPERLSRGLVLVVVAPRDPALPRPRDPARQRLVRRVADRRMGRRLPAGLIGLLVVIAGFALLFADRYPPGIFSFVLGLDRWVARVGLRPD